MQYYNNKSAIVTGAASGIGLALCGKLLEFGASKVVMADFNKDNLEREAARLAKLYPGRVGQVLCNVTLEDEVKEMIDYGSKFCGRIDLLINNAGAGLSGAFDELSNTDWEKAFALNFYGALYGIRAVLPVMLKQHEGQVINIISGIAYCPMAYQTMYSATKAALNGLTLALRSEYADDNIKFSSATPGTVATAIWKDYAIPEGAQTPEKSALAILDGASRNERIIFGDAKDRQGARHCFDADAASSYDEYLYDVARKRKSGAWVV